MPEDYGLVSVIVPAYNTEEYITPMLRCVVDQTYKNLEIIVVDDGSQDDTPKIVEEFAQKDSRIRLIRANHGGVSNARNIAIEHASGRKFFFFDSDDTFDLGLIEKCLEYAREKDTRAVLYGYCNRVNGVLDEPHQFSIHGIYRDDAIRNELLPHFIGHSYEDINQWIKGNGGLRAGKEHTALWRIMVDADTVRTAGLRFDTKLSLGEDTKFMNEYLLLESSIGVLEACLYYLTARHTGANMTSMRSPELMMRNKLKVIAAKLEVEEKYNISLRRSWCGTNVLSTIQLAIRLAKNTSGSLLENYKTYRQFLNNDIVKADNRAFRPAFGIRAIPFWFVILRLEFLLFVFCRICPDKILGKISG